jgi:predicted  nucleic acid-binding Zn-ribbon protein
MSEDRTQHLPNDDLRQILAQLISINSQLNDVRTRLERLEARDHDTKPIWENALKEIADTRAEMREGFEQVDAKLEQVYARIDKVQAAVDEARAETVTGLRKVAKQIDVMNRSILEVQAELRFMDDRVTKLEPQTAP